MLLPTGFLWRPPIPTPQTTGDPDDTDFGFENTTFVNRSLVLLNGNHIQKIGCYFNSAASATVKIVEDISGNGTAFAVHVSQAVSHGGGGWQDFTLTTPYTIPASGTFYLAVYTPSSGSTPYQTGKPRSYKSGDQTGSSSGWGANASAPALSARVNQE